MFDYVDYPAQPCWKCGEPVKGWQSKDADCGLEVLPPKAVRGFYSSCKACGAWNQYKVIAVAYRIEPDHGFDWEDREAERVD